MAENGRTLLETLCDEPTYEAERHSVTTCWSWLGVACQSGASLDRAGASRSFRSFEPSIMISVNITIPAYCVELCRVAFTAHDPTYLRQPHFVVLNAHNLSCGTQFNRLIRQLMNIRRATTHKKTVDRVANCRQMTYVSNRTFSL